MEAGEQPPEDPLAYLFADMDWGTPEVKPNDPLLWDIFENYDAAWVAKNKQHLTHYGVKDLNLVLDTSQDCNYLGINVSGRSTVPLGYYWGGEYVVYEELIDPTGWKDVTPDVERIKLSAQIDRNEQIGRFDARVDDLATRVDMGNPRIVEVQREHAAFIGGNLLDELLRRRNEFAAAEPYRSVPQQKPLPMLHADSATRAVAHLSPVELTGRKPIDEFSDKEDYLATQTRRVGTLLTVTVIGAYTPSPNGKVKNRSHYKEDIEVAFTESEYKNLTTADFHVIADLVSHDEIIELVELAHQVDELADEFEADDIPFDKKTLGATVRPKAWHDAADLLSDQFDQ